MDTDRKGHTNVECKDLWYKSTDPAKTIHGLKIANFHLRSVIFSIEIACL
jgi:hypothetical protein